MTEVLSYPFVTPEQNRLWVFDQANAHDGVRIANALDDQVSRLRVSLIPGLIDMARRNRSRGLWDLALVEAGSVFIPQAVIGTDDIPVGAERPAEDVVAALNASIPAQPWHVAGVFMGAAERVGVGVSQRVADVSDAIDAATQVARLAGGDLQVTQATHPSFHPGRFGHLVVNGTVVGLVGEVLPSIAHELDLPRRVAVFEINGELMLQTLGSDPHTMDPLSAFPAATQDISVVVGRDVVVGQLQDALAEGAGELLENITLVDIYRGEGVDDDKQSVTFALRFRAPDRTLTQEEATEAKNAGLAHAASRFGAVLRG
jgi:phenylalanyl-tRNA synthetase beta chain